MLYVIYKPVVYFDVLPYRDLCIGYIPVRVLYQIYNHRARGQGDYISDIARVAGYNQYMSRKTKPLLMSDASPTFLSALWRR